MKIPGCTLSSDAFVKWSPRKKSKSQKLPYLNFQMSVIHKLHLNIYVLTMKNIMKLVKEILLSN